MKKRKLVALLLAVLLMLAVGIGAVAETKKVNEARNGAVYLAEVLTIEGKDLEIASGTAFFVGKTNENPQYLVTCAHCVETYAKLGKGEKFMLKGVGAGSLGLRVFFDKNDFVEAYVVEANEVLDVAVLRIEKPTDKRKALKLKVPTDEMVSETAYAIGFPYSADVKDVVTAKGVNDLSVTTGTISRLITNSNFGRREIQMETKITHGNSGGPLVNEKGSVMGVNSNGITLSDTYENYAVNIAEVIDILDARGIPYAMEEGFPVGIVVVMGVVIVLLVVLIVVLSRKKNKRAKAGARVLVGEKGVLTGKTFELKRGQKMTIGRSAECQVRFPADTVGVSKVHCTVLYDGERVIVRDENSSAGTYIDENKINPGASVTLHRGHPLYIGSKAQMLMLRSKK